MAQITDRQKDSEIIARLIYMAFVAPERANINIGDVSFVPFAAALELYARAAARETVSESDAPLEPEESEALKMAAVGEAAAQGLYDGIRAGLQTAADTHTHTHTHTAGPNDGGGGKQDDFAGKGAQEKREILEHLQRFVDTYSGARRRIAKEANGALTYEEILAMSERKPLPLAKWRIADAAMRRIEGQDQ